MLARCRLVNGQSTRYVATREGIAWAGSAQRDPARVGLAKAGHWALCARLATVRDRENGVVGVLGEPRLRTEELHGSDAVERAELARLPDGRPRLRRPDLVLFPSDPALPVAVEVELSVKASRRLEAISRGWAQCRVVSEVRDDAPPAVARAVPVPFRSPRPSFSGPCGAVPRSRRPPPRR